MRKYEHQAQMVEVIRIVRTVGTGSDEDPIRKLTSYWTPNGKKIAEMDFNDDPYSPLHQ